MRKNLEKIALIRKLLAGKISEEELKELNSWYRYVEEKDEELVVFTDKQESKEQVKKRIHNRLKKQIRYEKEHSLFYFSRFKRTGRIVASVAAVLILAFTLFINIQNKEKKDSQIVSEVQFLERTNPNGQKSKIVLEDGTIVWLNSASSIRFPDKFKKTKRKVYLSGEAFFKVTHDESRPFTIVSENSKVTVLGTSFNVKTYEEEPLQVTVATGKVKVNTSDKAHHRKGEVILTRNEQVTYIPGTGELFKKKVDADTYVSWKEGILRFDHTKMSEVVHTLERWYDKKIVLENEKLASCVLVAEYKNERLYNVLKSIEFSLGVKCTVSEDVVIISGRGCNN